MVATKKISQFPSVGDQAPGDLLTGLRDGANNNFNPNSASGYAPLPYETITALTFQMAANNGYFANNAGMIEFTLPPLFDEGDVLELGAFGAGGWKILQNAGQQIMFGRVLTTAGTSGSVQSTSVGDSIKLVGVIANTSLMVVGAPQGNLIYA